jgi:hypothetical protein
MLKPWCDVAVVGIWYEYILLLLKFNVLFLLLNFRIAVVVVTEIWHFDVLLPLLESGQLLLLREK